VDTLYELRMCRVKFGSAPQLDVAFDLFIKCRIRYAKHLRSLAPFIHQLQLHQTLTARVTAAMNHGLVTWPGLSLCLFSQFAGIPMSFSSWGSRTHTHTDTCFKKHLSMKINLITIHYAYSHVERERSVDNEYIISLKAPKKNTLHQD